MEQQSPEDEQVTTRPRLTSTINSKQFNLEDHGVEPLEIMELHERQIAEQRNFSTAATLVRTGRRKWIIQDNQNADPVDLTGITPYSNDVYKGKEQQPKSGSWRRSFVDFGQFGQHEFGTHRMRDPDTGNPVVVEGYFQGMLHACIARSGIDRPYGSARINEVKAEVANLKSSNFMVQPEGRALYLHFNRPETAFEDIETKFLGVGTCHLYVRDHDNGQLLF
ncbi:MAG: hypothetical protein AAGI03_13565, partial [Pseudomonadota bacterium]